MIRGKKATKDGMKSGLQSRKCSYEQSPRFKKDEGNFQTFQIRRLFSLCTYSVKQGRARNWNVVARNFQVKRSLIGFFTCRGCSVASLPSRNRLFACSTQWNRLIDRPNKIINCDFARFVSKGKRKKYDSRNIKERMREWKRTRKVTSEIQIRTGNEKNYFIELLYNEFY